MLLHYRVFSFAGAVDVASDALQTHSLRRGGVTIRRLTIGFRHGRPLLALVLSACTYGPLETRRTIDGALPRPNTRVFAAAVRSELFRPPVGIAKFPDGGAERVERQAVTFYAGDIDAGTVRSLATLAAPNEVWTGFHITMLGWTSDAVYAVLTGCPRSECDPRSTNRLIYRIALDGTLTRVVGEAPSLERASGMVARAPGETVYTRLSINRDSIETLTVDGGRLVPRYAIDAAGVLIALPRAPAP